jgi:predicted transcriptional regulator of viral defense system
MGAAVSLGRLAGLTEAQHGLVTARQAELRGVPRRDLARLAQSGGLERVAYGVYRVAGAPRARLLELRAAWLQLAPGVDVDQRVVAGGVVSHASAATVFGVGLLEPVRHEFTVPGPRRVRSGCVK